MAMFKPASKSRQRKCIVFKMPEEYSKVKVWHRKMPVEY